MIVSFSDCLVAIVTADLVCFISADCQLFMSQSFDHRSLRSLNHWRFWSSKIFDHRDFDHQRWSHQSVSSEVLCRTLDSFSDFQFNDTAVNKLDQSVAEFRLRHRICRIAVFVNSSDLCNFSSLVRLFETHQIDHQSFFCDCVYFTRQS
jgi:hypothetical protein